MVTGPAGAVGGTIHSIVYVSPAVTFSSRPGLVMASKVGSGSSTASALAAKAKRAVARVMKCMVWIVCVGGRTYVLRVGSVGWRRMGREY